MSVDIERTLLHRTDYPGLRGLCSCSRTDIITTDCKIFPVEIEESIDGKHQCSISLSPRMLDEITDWWTKHKRFMR